MIQLLFIFRLSYFDNNLGIFAIGEVVESEHIFIIVECRSVYDAPALVDVFDKQYTSIHLIKIVLSLGIVINEENHVSCFWCSHLNHFINLNKLHSFLIYKKIMEHHPLLKLAVDRVGVKSPSQEGHFSTECVLVLIHHVTALLHRHTTICQHIKFDFFTFEQLHVHRLKTTPQHGCFFDAVDCGTFQTYVVIIAGCSVLALDFEHVQIALLPKGYELATPQHLTQRAIEIGMELAHGFANELAMILGQEQLAQPVYVIVEHVHAVGILVIQWDVVVLSETHHLIHNSLGCVKDDNTNLRVGCLARHFSILSYEMIVLTEIGYLLDCIEVVLYELVEFSALVHHAVCLLVVSFYCLAIGSVHHQFVYNLDWITLALETTSLLEHVADYFLNLIVALSEHDS